MNEIEPIKSGMVLERIIVGSGILLLIGMGAFVMLFVVMCVI